MPAVIHCLWESRHCQDVGSCGHAYFTCPVMWVWQSSVPGSWVKCVALPDPHNPAPWAALQMGHGAQRDPYGNGGRGFAIGVPAIHSIALVDFRSRIATCYHKTFVASRESLTSSLTRITVCFLVAGVPALRQAQMSATQLPRVGHRAPECSQQSASSQSVFMHHLGVRSYWCDISSLSSIRLPCHY